MRYSVIFSVLFVVFFIGCNDKECDPVSPPIDDRVSFEISFLDYSDNNYFIDGYKEVVVQKRIINSIKGGLIGLGTGIVVAILIHNYVK